MENFYNFHFHKYQRIIRIRKVGLIDLWKIFVPTMEMVLKAIRRAGVKKWTGAKATFYLVRVPPSGLLHQ